MDIGSLLKKKIFDIAKNSKTIRVVLRGERDAIYRAKMVMDDPFVKIDDRLVYFQTFSGRGYSDSPKAMYEYMLKAPEYRDFRFVWSFREPEKYSFLLENGVSLRSVYNDFIAFTKGCDFLSYNGNGYDAPILHYNLKRLGLEFSFEGRTWYDALLLERIHTAGMVDENGEKVRNNLTAAYTRYYGHPFEGAHNSLDDVMATIEVFKAQITAHGWKWAQRDEFGFICFDRWLTKKGSYYYLTQGAHKGESIESMMRIDKSYLDWIINKCQWTDDQTREIIDKVLRGDVQCTKETPKTPSRGKKRPKGTISEADLSLF